MGLFCTQSLSYAVFSTNLLNKSYKKYFCFSNTFRVSSTNLLNAPYRQGKKPGSNVISLNNSFQVRKTCFCILVLPLIGDRERSIKIKSLPKRCLSMSLYLSRLSFSIEYSFSFMDNSLLHLRKPFYVLIYL